MGGWLSQWSLRRCTALPQNIQASAPSMEGDAQHGFQIFPPPISPPSVSKQVPFGANGRSNTLHILAAAMPEVPCHCLITVAGARVSGGCSDDNCQRGVQLGCLPISQQRNAIHLNLVKTYYFCSLCIDWSLRPTLFVERLRGSPAEDCHLFSAHTCVLSTATSGLINDNLSINAFRAQELADLPTL